MKTALFTNFTDEDFTGYWDGKGKTFKAGQSVYMPDYLAEHFANHLVNRELLRRKPDGALLIPNGDKFVSPKKPKEVPAYMELFNKAFTPEDAEELGGAGDDIDALIGAANKNHAQGKTVPQPDKLTTVETSSDVEPTQKQDSTGPQTILPPDFDEEEDDSEENFGGKPEELTIETPGTN